VSYEWGRRGPSEAERGQRHLKGNTHLTDRFAVKGVAVEVRSEGHGKQP
jgi:hypothetical protein